MVVGLKFKANRFPAFQRLDFCGKTIAKWPAGVRATEARCDAVYQAWAKSGRDTLTTQEAADAMGLAGLLGETARFGASIRALDKAGR